MSNAGRAVGATVGLRIYLFYPVAIPEIRLTVFSQDYWLIDVIYYALLNGSFIDILLLNISVKNR